MRSPTKLLIATLFVCWAAIVPQQGQASSEGVRSEERDLINESSLGAPIAEERLAKQDGRQDTQIDQLNAQMSDLRSSATFSGNSFSALNSTVTTGINSIAQDAFSNATGIVTVIQNSGNQVLIQNDMILNLWVK
ncbi:hypothetical protein [Geomesophilobacter sediminis]|uniref:Uncharacterized protein n=1 Tax=Geomesophilobacter sediminis TaxID=2798584 RepID=A0A8J7M3H9_9BACT|nr:hypothetical protein [Geomesophilobacter sediminis]MBJ6727973.1 hypothetical protein [Geomesophilobacter sediminis]